MFAGHQVLVLETPGHTSGVWLNLMTRLIFVLAFKVEWLTPSVHTKAFRWLYIYFYQVMCAIILLVLELYLQVTPCSIYHAESFLKGLHSRFFLLACKYVHIHVCCVKVLLDFRDKLLLRSAFISPKKSLNFEQQTFLLEFLNLLIELKLFLHCNY